MIISRRARIPPENRNPRIAAQNGNRRTAKRRVKTSFNMKPTPVKISVKIKNKNFRKNTPENTIRRAMPINCNIELPHFAKSSIISYQT
ncbi:hypothetical protein EXM22_11950 [Oceanispirochaeta crateris]|uniref:Uncharacterized protein n=1 Tax=Oceanispirochaeta crateris TaxID=2518645 RepID=A0A5C1QKI9_9SPIO|nr:hypothetical protein [Oceanispirochaeta crateris]QEN08665.1 hypothetical protein EXM22_11950 [Oceanispirochaeta crateris]